jgi:hypothetical protein
MTDIIPEIDFDEPLQKGSAIQSDKLGRLGFARSVVSALKKVTSRKGFVISIEGGWGSGKTSTLAMIEELMESANPESSRPVIVHFNPWLVGDRDALLGQFLTQVATSVKLSDRAKEGKKVAKELGAYAKAFDLIKLIPGAEPWATIAKSVLSAAGETAGAIADQKSQDISQRKEALEEALRKFPRPIIVFIDDVDRLFPSEVFEMVRIIKAVGDLPHVGYVIAWDTSYVVDALRSASIPQSDTYLDKVVQIRMPIPTLSSSARDSLANEALATLHPDALGRFFKNDQESLSLLYFAGLRDLFQQPRDITRVFNSVSTFEPALRGELGFADIVGMAALIVKAPAVFDLLRRQPRWFVGRMPGDNGIFDKTEEIIDEGLEARRSAINTSSAPRATQQLVHFLFPLTAKSDDAYPLRNAEFIQGHIGHPARLVIALQMFVGHTDVSLVAAGKFLSHPEQRTSIAGSLSSENCVEFLEGLGDLVTTNATAVISDLEELCIAISRLLDTVPFVKRARERTMGFSFAADLTADRTILSIVKASWAWKAAAIAAAISFDPLSLTVAARILVNSYLSNTTDTEETLTCSPEDRVDAFTKFSENALNAAKENRLLGSGNIGLILRVLSRGTPDRCPEIFEVVSASDSSLDSLAIAILDNGFDSVKGQRFAIPENTEVIKSYCSLALFRDHAERRLKDSSLDYPVRAAWQCVVDGSNLYAIDGSDASR